MSGENLAKFLLRDACKFYRTAFVPTYPVEHGSKQYYHLAVRSDCIPAS